MKKYFYFYTKADRNLKNSLISYIKSKNSNINIWDDDELVLPGENWMFSLSKKAFDADIFIFLLSDEYYQSDISLNEQFFLQKIIDEKGNAIQIKLKKLLEPEYLELENKDILEVIQTHNQKEKVI